MCEPIDLFLEFLKFYGVGCGFAAITVSLWNKIEKNPKDLFHPAMVFASWLIVIIGLLHLPFVVVHFIYDKFKPYIDILLHYKNEK